MPNSKKPTISALIIAKNEERDLPGCLASLAGLAEQIVVLVDSESSDATEQIARKAGCTVARRRFDDYARQRQAALELCENDWVLWIDADERADGLRRAIRSELAHVDRISSYSIAFRVRFLGRDLRFGGLGGERHVRLFRRDGARFIGGLLHERLEVPGLTGGLDGVMRHEPYRDVSEYLGKLDRYTTLAAQKKHAAGRRFSPLDHFVLPWELFRRVVLFGAFLDGWQGLTWAGLSAFHHWLKYVKLKEMEGKA